MSADTVTVAEGDALLIVDVQRDFLPGGGLTVPDGQAVVPVLNRCIQRFREAGLPIYASREWQPSGHAGGGFAQRLDLGPETHRISKATDPESNADSAFEGTDLAAALKTARIQRLFVGGLATDYSVLHTVRDALREGLVVFLLDDAVRGVNLEPGDDLRARQDMLRRGAQPVSLEALGA
ncbi:MAG TPA: isochorismatase family protein [Gammaproteobacteria bacterium]|nr:isochorismatase family protein [Gammaproteobacteria bacterium]